MDISKYLPKTSKTVDAIYEYHKERGDSEQFRGYLGMSEIGAPCERAVWYNFRQCCKPSFSGRLYRLFETGDLEEFRFCKELRAIGCEVHDTDSSGNQWAVSELGGHFSGHMDSAILGVPEAPKTWHVGEFKTHNDKSFAELKIEGVKKSKPQHYNQCMCYMAATGMTRALYLAKNKDTDELYSERINYDKAEAEALMDRARRIITSATPPERIATRKDFYLCGWCDAKEICWGSEASALPVPSLSCRQCCHATAELDGQARWSCKHRGLSLTMEQQNSCCPDHLVLPGLLVFSSPMEYMVENGKDRILFQNEDNSQWVHGDGPGALDSRSLMAMPPSLTVDPMARKASDVFDMTVINVQDDIQARYSGDCARLVWTGKPDELIGKWAELYDGDDLRTLKPISQCANEFYRGIEVDPGRAAIYVTEDRRAWAEIREMVQP